MEYFYGPDTYAAREAITAVANKENAQVRWVDRQHLEEKSLNDVVSQGSGLFGKDLVVVRDPSALPAALHEDVMAAVTRGSNATPWILWDRGAPDKRSKLWRSLKPLAREFSSPSAADLVQWLIGRAQDLGTTVELPAAQALVRRLGTDRWRLVNELERLVLVADGKAVTVALLDQEVAVQEEAEIFSILDGLGRGERARVVQGVQTLLAAGHSEFYVLSMLSYQFRTLLLVRVGLDRGQAGAVIAREGKLHPYVVEKNMPAARRLPAARWRDGLTRILATDFAIKQGKVDARTGLLMLVLTLSEKK